MHSACQTSRPRALGPAQGIKPKPHQFCSALFSSNCTNGAQPNSYIHIHGPKCCRSFFLFFLQHLPTPKREREKSSQLPLQASLSERCWKLVSEIMKAWHFFLIKTLPKPLKKEASNRKWWPVKANDGCLHHQKLHLTDRNRRLFAEGRLLYNSRTKSKHLSGQTKVLYQMLLALN